MVTKFGFKPLMLDEHLLVVVNIKRKFMSNTYSVVLTGKLLDGYEPKSVQESFSELFKLSQDKVQAYFNGQPKVVKKAIDHQTAARFKAKIEGLGASVELRPVASSNNNVSQKSVQQAPVKAKPVQKSLQSSVEVNPTKAAKAKKTKVKKAFTEFTLDDCVNEIDFGRKKQLTKMKAVEIVDEPRSRVTMLLGLSFITYACADLALAYTGIMQLTGTYWVPAVSALVGLVAIKSSSGK